MPGREQGWVVLVQDVSDSISVKDEPAVLAAIVVDVASGKVLGARLGSGLSEVLGEALHAATGDASALCLVARPSSVRCCAGLGGAVAEVLATHYPGATPFVSEEAPLAEAEELFDSLLGHLVGRSQPGQPPEPEAWAIAFAVVLELSAQKPWRRWSEAVALRVERSTPEGPASYLAAVLGARGVQRGLIFHLGADALAFDLCGCAREAMAPGTLLVLLDEPEELPAGLAEAARRDGWPEGEGVAAFFATNEDRGPADPGRVEREHLTLGTPPVVAHDRRGPILLGANSVTFGERPLARRRQGRSAFSVFFEVERTA